MTLYIGLMSGTSMDGIDAALVSIPSNKLECGITKNYSDEVRRFLDKIQNDQQVSLPQLCQFNTLIGRDFAAAVNELLLKAKINPKEIKAIGSHGQTVCHDTNATIPYTLQMGCAHTISSLTGITVVADFRTRDMVNGGQGAPFAPLYHQELFSATDETVAVINIGGIANITLLSPITDTVGWDVGPGNCLMDAWIHHHKGSTFDRDGDWASKGTVIESLLTSLLTDPFLHLPSPKSIGKEYYSLDWLDGFLNENYAPQDVQSTLCAFTAYTIAKSVLDNAKLNMTQLYLCGGGTHNLELVRMLTKLLPKVAVKSSSEKGVDPDYLEAMMFAWLAAQTINHMPVNLSAITGSKGLEILGAVHPIIKSY